MRGPDAGNGSRAPLLEVLAESRAAGFLGPGPLEPQLAHAEGFVAAGRSCTQRSGDAGVLIADLGSGGGLPGLVMARRWPEAQFVLIEANGRRAAFLRRAVARLDIADRVEVVQRRAEECGRDSLLRFGFDGVVARSFGRPAVVAECAAPLLKVGGFLVVSEPPGHPEGPTSTSDPDEPHADAIDSAGPRDLERAERWPSQPLAALGLETVGIFEATYEYRVLRQHEQCPERYPRRNGVPAKRPLF